MKGALGKTRKGEPKEKSPEKDTSDAVSSPNTDDLSAVPGGGNCSDCGLVFSIEASTPEKEREKMRLAQEACLTSTPVHSTTFDVPSTISGSPPEGELQYTEFITQIKTTAVDSQSKPQRKRKRPVKQRQTKTQTQTDGKTDDPPVKCRRGRKPKRETVNLNKDKSSSRSRPRFELQKAEVESQGSVLFNTDVLNRVRTGA